MKTRSVRKSVKRGVAKNYVNENLRPSRGRSLGATIPGGPERDLTKQNRHQAMAMARQKVEEHPLLAAIIQSRLDHVVGEGFTLMMRTKDRAYNKDVEALWYAERDYLDIRGMRRWGRLQRCWDARACIDGDVGIILAADEFDGKPKSYLQTIEADRICKAYGDPKDEGYDVDAYGLPKRFYVSRRNPGPTDKPISYDAKDFILFAHDRTERAERMRGMSDLLVIFNIVQDYRDILDGIVRKVKNEAFWGLKFTIKPASATGGIAGDAQTVKTAENGTDWSTVEVLPNSNVVLGDNEDVTPIESSAPHSEFDAFEKKIVARIAAACGLSYELVTGDYSGLNYTSSRSMRESILKYIRPEQAELGFVSSRIFQWWLSRHVKYGTIKPPSSIANTWWSHSWGMPGFGHLNPQQEAMAQEIMLRNQLTSRRIIAAERNGEDIDDVLDDLADEQSGMMDRGLLVEAPPPLPPPLPDERTDNGNKNE